MDPNATFALALEQAEEGELSAACDTIGELLRWILSGGFLPDGLSFTTVCRTAERMRAERLRHAINAIDDW